MRPPRGRGCIMRARARMRVIIMIEIISTRIIINEHVHVYVCTCVHTCKCQPGLAPARGEVARAGFVVAMAGWLCC